MDTHIASLEEGLGRLTSLEDVFRRLSNDNQLSLDQLKAQARVLFVCHMMISENDNSMYSRMLKAMERLENKESFLCSLKQAIACRVHDIINDMVKMMNGDDFIVANLRHQCSRKMEKVTLLELADNGGDTLCLIARSNGNRILRFHKNGREVQTYNLAEYEGYDHEIHYPDQLDDDQLVDLLPEIIAGFSRTLLIPQHTHS